MGVSKPTISFNRHISLENVIEEHATGNLEAAKKGYQIFIDQNYQDALPYANLAGIYMLENRLESALELSRKAIAIDPDFVDAYTKLGCILELLNQTDSSEIIHCYKKAIDLQPENALAHFSLGNIYVNQGCSDQGLEYLQKAVDINPHYANAHLNIGNLQVGKLQYEQAANSFERAVSIDRSLRGALCAHWHMRMRMCDWSDYPKMLASLSSAIEESKDSEKSLQTINTIVPFTFFNLYDDPELLLTTSELYVQSILQSIVGKTRQQTDTQLITDQNKDQSNRIKIAFLSADYHNHATAFLMAELFELMDKDKFEIHAISFDTEGENSAMRKRILAACCYFHDVKLQTDKQIAQLIVDQNIDIAVDLKGFTQNSRPAILAYRPAPIQVNYLGYPGTMGADFIDYIIADPYVIPQQEQTFYSEKIAYLPDSYQVNDRCRPIREHIPSRADCGLPDEGFIFCSFNNSYKITPDIFDIWMDLLRETPNSVLWLLEGNPWVKENLQVTAKEKGIDPSRLIFSKLLRLDYHLARAQNADLFLDTFPCNAHTTASDALWIGLPLITCSGRSFASRVAGSLLTAVDLPELITTELKSYKELALELANKPEKLSAIKTQLIKNRENCKLFDTDHYKNNLQIAFQRMIELRRNTSSNETFYVSDLEGKPVQQNTQISTTTPFNFDDTPDAQEITLEDVIEKHTAGDLFFAKKGYQAFIDAKRQTILPYSNLASIYFQENDIEKAIELLKQGLEIDPTYVDAYMKLGSLLEIHQQDDDLKEAMACYENVIKLKPDHVQAHFSLGNLLSHQNQTDQAILHLQKAVEISPEYALANFNLGNLLQIQGDLDKAANAFMKAVTIDPSLKNAACKYVHSLMHMCDWSDYENMISLIRSTQNIQDQSTQISKTLSPFTLLNIIDDPSLHLKASKSYLTAKTSSVKISKHLFVEQNKNSDDLIKIAFLSSDFYDHATSYLIAEIFELFDQEKFETHVISFGKSDQSEISKRIQSTCHRFYEVADKTDQEIAQIIADQKIDIAIDLKGFTQNCRPEILAYRPAPIQVNYLGYPGSMGAAFIDYIIADPFIIPEDQRSNYSENIMYLPDSYQVNDRNRSVHHTIPSRQTCGLPTNGFVFSCFNNNYKITPDIFRIWMELLKETPGSVLWLLENNSWAKNNLKKEAETYGINSARLIFAQPISNDYHLARIQNADLFLDTFPCNAHTTASDALWVGLPLLTCVGKGFASRVAGSLLKAMDLENLITTDLDTYKTVALELAHHPETLYQIKTTLKNKHNSCALFDTEKFKNNLQRGFKHMLNLHGSGVEAETFHVSDLAEEPTEHLLLKSNNEPQTTQENDVLPINIALIHPQNYDHSDVFNEVAETLFHSFNEMGFNTQVTKNTFIEDGINIIIGVNLLNEADMELIPNSSIIYNFEQITNDSDWITPAFFDLLKRFEIWDYSKKNIAALKEKGITRVHHVPVGYTPSLTRIPKAEIQDIDVLFYGSTNERRLKILNGLKATGLKVETLYGVYGAERDEYISRSKVIVNIHYYDSNIFEQVRVSYLLANKKAVVTECSETTEVDENLRDAVVLAPYDQIIEKCYELVKSDQTRLALEEKGFECFKNRNTVEYLNSALNALGKEVASDNIVETKVDEFTVDTSSFSPPFISILIPSYNSAKYIKESILSALNQDYPNFEVVVVNDGSTDNTIDIVNSINNPRLKLITKEHSGAPATRNQCIAEAAGDYFLWLDSDDELMPDVLTQYTILLQQHPELDIIYGDLEMFHDTDGTKQIHTYPDHHEDRHLLPHLLQGCGIPNGGSLVRKSIYNRFGGYDESFRRAHDYEFWCRVVRLSNIKHSGMISYRYRQHDSNMSFGNDNLDLSFEAAIIKRVCNRYGVRELSPELDWTNENKAYVQAWSKIGNILQKHHDYKNALIAFQQASKTVEDDASQFELAQSIKSLIVMASNSRQNNSAAEKYLSTLKTDNQDMETNPLVSVIIFGMSHSDQLEYALKSLIEQTHTNWEAVVINDSNAEQHAQIDPLKRVTFINCPDDINLAASLNTVIPYTKGSVISYLNNGTFSTDHIETIVETLNKNKAEFVYSKATCTTGNDQKRIEPESSQFKLLSDLSYSKDLLDIANYIPMNTWGHRRELLKKSGLFDSDLDTLEDWEMLLRFSRLTDIKQTLKSTVVIEQELTDSDVPSSALYQSLYSRYPVDNEDVQSERIELLTSFNSQVTQQEEVIIPNKLNIGSGKDFKEDCLNIDTSENCNPDVVIDLSEPNVIGHTTTTKRFGDVIFTKNQFEEIIANDVLEHIPDLVSAMTNCLDLLKIGGQFKINVPYDLSYGAWQDPTHVRAFNERSWMYYTDWFWYLGWKEARFDIASLDFSLSPIGTRMQQEGQSIEQILTQPRAVDNMSVTLTKRLLTDEERASGLLRMNGA